MGCQSIAGLLPSIKFAGTHLYTWVERGTVRVKCLAQEHNAMSPARARTRTARSWDERTNHEATAPPTYHFRSNFKYRQRLLLFSLELPWKNKASFFLYNLNYILEWQSITSVFSQAIRNCAWKPGSGLTNYCSWISLLSWWSRKGRYRDLFR